MKLPALAIATAFALGIACGLEIAHRSNAHKFVALVLCSASTSLFIGMFFVWRSRVVVAGLASLLCWVMLGVAAVCIEEQPRRADHILSLLDAGKINIKSPLRYYGRLADEPKILPWGVGYDVEPSGVDYQGLFVLASGGTTAWLYCTNGSCRTVDAAHGRSHRGFDTSKIAAGIQGRRSVRSPGLPFTARR